MNHDDLAPYPLLILRLSGTQAEMGAQQGALLRQVGGYERLSHFYPSMATRMLTHGVPHHLRAPTQRLVGGLLRMLAARMHQHRRKRFAQYVARTEALLEAGGIPKPMAASLLVMEILQNAVGLLGRAGVLPSAGLSAVGVPACSSLSVWGAASRDGCLRHARNFDFPGAGVWDHAPSVVFCTPDEGLRYASVTTRGADVPGITAFNEAGLTLTVHTRFHRDVRFDAPPVFDLGHEIIRRASSLSQAVDVARRLGSASTWGLLVSSARERSAVLIETTGAEVDVLEAPASAQHLSCTNRYLSRRLQAGEISTSEAFVADSEGRKARLDQAVHEASQGLSSTELEALLGDLRAVDAVDAHDGVQRLAGDCIVSPISVQSVVAEPEQERICVSLGRAPTGFGPFVQVPWSWDDAPGMTEISGSDVASQARDHRGAPLDRARRALARRYAEIARLHFDGEVESVLRDKVESLASDAPSEPSFRTLAGYLALRTGDLEAALGHFDVALALEHGERRRAGLLLFKTRTLSALGRPSFAAQARHELSALSGKASLSARSEARLEATRPISREKLCRLVIDYHLIEARIPGMRGA